MAGRWVTVSLETVRAGSAGAAQFCFCTFMVYLSVAALNQLSKLLFSQIMG